MKVVLRDYYRHTREHTVVNLQKMDPFPANHMLPKLTQGEAGNLHGPSCTEASRLLNPSNKTPRRKQVHWGIPPDIPRRSNSNSTRALPGNRTCRICPVCVLSPASPKARQGPTQGENGRRRSFWAQARAPSDRRQRRSVGDSAPWTRGLHPGIPRLSNIRTSIGQSNHI